MSKNKTITNNNNHNGIFNKPNMFASLDFKAAGSEVISNLAPQGKITTLPLKSGTVNDPSTSVQPTVTPTYAIGGVELLIPQGAATPSIGMLAHNIQENMQKIRTTHPINQIITFSREPLSNDSKNSK